MTGDIDNRKMTRRVRVDALLVEQGLAPTLEMARALILAGRVVVRDQRAHSAGQLVRRDVTIRVKDGRGASVGRGVDKLQGALDDFGIADAFREAMVLDVGASTGGFTQTALTAGARRVYALDVGTNQLDWRLRTDARVVSIERTDVRDFVAPADVVFDWVVCDVSFTSIARIVPDLVRIAGLRARLLLLVKPQFELPREMIPDGGVVSDDALRERAVSSVKSALIAALGETAGKEDSAWRFMTRESRVAGRAGNREIFLLAERKT